MVTAQSVTCQPCRPWRSVSPHGLLDRREERVAASSRARPRAGTARRSRAAPGSTRSPTWPGTGCGASSMTSTAAPVPTGRSTQIVVVSRKLDVEAEVVGQRRLDDLLLHLAVERDEQLLPHVVLAQVDQRVLLGELGQRGVQRARSAGAAGHDHRLQRRRREVVAAPRPRRGDADRVADPDVAEAPQLADLPGARPTSRRTAAPRSKTLIAVTLPLARRRRTAAGRATRTRARRTSARRRSSPRPGRARP